MTHPEGYTELGEVGFTDKGPYLSNYSYVKNDIVHYAGSLYKCKIDDTINVTPGENANWTVFIGEPKSLVERIIAPLEDNPATVAYAAGRQIIYDDYLWELIDDVSVGDPLVDYDVDPINANIKKASPVETQLLEEKAKVGNLASLPTAVKTSLVAAINEVVGSIGSLSSLATTIKTSLVGAINEVDAHADTASDKADIVQAQLSNSGDAFDPTRPYKAGELCIHDNTLKRCTTACSAASWDVNASCFTDDTLVNVGNTINTDLKNRPIIIWGTYVGTTGISTFTFPSRNNGLYIICGGRIFGGLIVKNPTTATYNYIDETGVHTDNVTGSNYTFSLHSEWHITPYAICFEY